MVSSTSANSGERMEELIPIVLPLARLSFACPVSLCCCGLCGLKGTSSGRDSVSPANGSERNFLISEMSKSVHKSTVRAFVPSVPCGGKRMNQEEIDGLPVAKRTVLLIRVVLYLVGALR